MADTKLIYEGTVKDGVITLPKRLRKEVVQAFNDRSIEVTFRRKCKRRSNEQNKYYWSCVIPAIVHGMIDLGNDALQIGNSEHTQLVHEFLKSTILNNGEEIKGIEGLMFKLPASTTRCTTVEFMEFIDKVRVWAGENLGVTIPEPNEQVEMFEPTYVNEQA